ncbi:MAG: hypothetical protein L3J74_15965 [Bacteroidales bacterium]|nr:hypothetical protein [Bacteroidales bacterium]
MKYKTKQKVVLIGPLNWGLGHATRDIPIIKHYLKNNYKVIIAADKAPLSLLKQEFPELEFIKLPAPEINYATKQKMIFKMLISIPKILWGIYNEHHLLKKIIKKHAVDIIISDNRYGLWNKNTYNIFITHQLEIQTPLKLSFVKNSLNKINHLFIKKFNKCWVPDYEFEPTVAGKLSHTEKKPENVEYIGLLSRFQDLKIKTINHDYQILVILSGPEPQRSILQKILQEQISQSGKKALFVLGKPNKSIKYTKGSINFINHLPANKLAAYIISTPYIISRSGYSSIMDYLYLKKTVILIPTPGQTEQEYLSAYFKKKQWFYACEQDKFNLETALLESKKYTCPINIFQTDIPLL